MKSKLCYRFVKDDLTSENGHMKWKIGKWNKIEGKLECCENGLHASLTPLDSLNNIFGNRWFIAEYKGEIDKEEDKFCASEMRLIKEIPIIVIKRFALFCAKQCLANYEKKYPKDNRVSECIRINELYLDEKATLKEWSAEWSAAWSTAKKLQNKELLRLIKEKNKNNTLSNALWSGVVKKEGGNTQRLHNQPRIILRAEAVGSQWNSGYFDEEKEKQ